MTTPQTTDTARTRPLPPPARPALPGDPLEAIGAEGRDVLLTPRPLPREAAAYLDEACQGDPFDVEFDALAGAPDVAALTAWMPAGRGLRWLERDIDEQLARFARLAGPRPFRVGFERITGDKCRKFHVDQVELRMLITYAGPGTEWVDDRDARRDLLGLHPHCHIASNAAVVPDAAKIQRASPGDILLLKGARCPGNEGRGAIHRSPPIGDAGLRRLLLVATLLPALSCAGAAPGVTIPGCASLSPPSRC